MPSLSPSRIFLSLLTISPSRLSFCDLFATENFVAERSESKERHVASLVLLILSPQACALMREEVSLSLPSAFFLLFLCLLFLLFSLLLPCTRASARVQGRRKFCISLLLARVCSRKGREEGGKFSSPLERLCVKGRRRVFLSFASPHTHVSVRGRKFSPSLFLSHLPSFSIWLSLFPSSQRLPRPHTFDCFLPSRDKREKSEERSRDKRRERRELRAFNIIFLSLRKFWPARVH